MARLQISAKRIAMSKANTQMVVAASIAAFVTVFCLTASHALISQQQYRSRVIKEKEKVHTQLKRDVKSVSSLVDSYNDFNQEPVNVIGGPANGDGDKAGSNTRIILDALPSKYDFPALTSSLEKILKDKGLQGGTITGSDDEIAQQVNAASVAAPQAIPMPFTLSVAGINYAAAQELILTFERSVRPMQIDTLALTGGSSDMSLTITAHTYYQPGKEYKFTTKAVR